MLTLVVVDTNIIAKDFWMRGRAFRMLIESQERGHQLAVPEIVIEEARSVFAREAAERIDRMRKDAQWLWRNGLPGDALKLPGDGAAAAVATYSADLEKRLQVSEARLLPYPKIAHKALVNMANARRRPFDDHGTGYRDALIWHSVLEAFSDSNSIVFVSANTRDFGEKGPDGGFVLHEDLQKDVQARRKAVNAKGGFSLVSSLEEYVSKDIAQYFEEPTTAKHKLQSGKYPSFSVVEWLMNELADVNARDRYVDEEGEVAGEGLDAVDEVLAYSVTDVRRLAGGDLAVELEAKIRGSVYFFESVKTARGRPGVRILGRIQTSGELRGYVSVAEETLLLAKCSFVINPKKGTVSDETVALSKPSQV